MSTDETEQDGMPKAHSSLVRRIKRARLTFLGTASFRQLSQELLRLDAEEVPGDVIECGVALGGSGVFIANAVAGRRKFFGFDVFEMIPPPTDEDPENAHRRYKVISTGAAKGRGSDEYYGYRQNLFAEVKSTFSGFGVPVDDIDVTLIRGRVEETTPQFLPSTIAFAHIDTDWYASVSHLLPEVAARMTVGGTIVVDDYHSFAGARKATDEFVTAHGNFQIISTDVNCLMRKLR